MLKISIMLKKDYIITIIAHFFFKLWEGNLKYKVDSSADLMLRRQSMYLSSQKWCQINCNGFKIKCKLVKFIEVNDHYAFWSLFLTKQSLICDLIFAWTWNRESKCHLMKTFSVNLDVNNGFRFELNLIY